MSKKHRKVTIKQDEKEEERAISIDLLPTNEVSKSKTMRQPLKNVEEPKPEKTRESLRAEYQKMMQPKKLASLQNPRPKKRQVTVFSGDGERVSYDIRAFGGKDSPSKSKATSNDKG